jgi:methionyl-tRNA formyltransferase
MKDINFAFFGTPSVASRTLDILLESGYTPKVIVTSPDARSGRGMHMTKTPVGVWAREHNIPCLKPEKVNKEFMKEFSKYMVTLSIVVAYGKILPEALIDLPAYGTINIHYSLLPLYRGASPVEEALLNGDKETGVSIQQMAFKLDSGAILAEQTVPIGHDEMKEELRARLIDIGGVMLCRMLPGIIEGSIASKAQDESNATFCTKIKKKDGEISLDGDGDENYNKYAFEGWPGVYFFIDKDGKKIRIKIKKAKYEDNSFIIKRVVPEGKKEMDYEVFLNTLK